MKTVKAVSALALLLGSGTAAAGQVRASMSVTATVTPACSVAIQASARHRADIACSTGASVSTMTAARRDAQPLDEAEALLGAPVRRAGAIVFTAPAESPSAAQGEAEPARYLTVTY